MLPAPFVRRPVADQTFGRESLFRGEPIAQRPLRSRQFHYAIAPNERRETPVFSAAEISQFNSKRAFPSVAKAPQRLTADWSSSRLLVFIPQLYHGAFALAARADGAPSIGAIVACRARGIGALHSAKFRALRVQPSRQHHHVNLSIRAIGLATHITTLRSIVETNDRYRAFFATACSLR